MMWNFLTSLALLAIIATQATAQLQIQNYNYTQNVSADGAAGPWDPGYLFGQAPYYISTIYSANLMNSDPDNSYVYRMRTDVLDSDGNIVMQGFSDGTIGPATDIDTPVFETIAQGIQFPIPSNPDSLYVTQWHVLWGPRLQNSFDATDFPMYEYAGP